MFHFRVDEREARECRLIHGIYEVLITVGETRLFTKELPIKVAAVIWCFL